mmetsp:Transcript_41260/g.98984  ORF Transcript_41260/g.98984 Transcript_41260/m.98984 type:complete len:243 (-) Transcript_41260:518-1246(-)
MHKRLGLLEQERVRPLVRFLQFLPLHITTPSTRRRTRRFTSLRHTTSTLCRRLIRHPWSIRHFIDQFAKHDNECGPRHGLPPPGPLAVQGSASIPAQEEQMRHGSPEIAEAQQTINIAFGNSNLPGRQKTSPHILPLGLWIIVLRGTFHLRNGGVFPHASIPSLARQPQRHRAMERTTLQLITCGQGCVRLRGSKQTEITMKKRTMQREHLEVRNGTIEVAAPEHRAFAIQVKVLQHLSNRM